MPFFIVGQDTNFERIAGNLLRSGATAEAVTDLRRRLVEANPGLDLDRLAPGTVIDVPRRPGVQTPSGDGSLASTVRDGVGGLQGELKEQLALIAQVAEAGLVNAADAADTSGSGYPQTTAEALIKANPDLMFLGDSVMGETPDKVKARPGWSAVTAVAKGNVVALDSDIASRWGPRVVDLMRAITDAVAHSQT